MNNNQAIEGPKLNDEDFFIKVIDTSKNGMESLAKAIIKRDFSLCRKLFAEYIRSHLDCEKFLNVPFTMGDNDFMFSGESEQEAADRILTHKFISCGTPFQLGDVVDWFANPTENQYKEWTWQLNRHHEWMLLAKAYQNTKDEKYSKCFAELFDSWVKQAIIPDNEGFYETLCWRTIEMGIRIAHNWSVALHVFCHSKYFTDDLLINWYKSVWEHGWRLYNKFTARNWLIMEMNGLAHIAVLFPEFKDSKQWLERSLEQLESELDNQIYPDGFQNELSTNYHEVVIKNYFMVIDLIQAYDIQISQSFKNKFENACNLNIKLVMPDYRLPNLGDGKWLDIKESLKKYMKFFPHREDYKWFVSNGKLGQPPKHLSICLPYSGLAVMRNSWDENATWAVFDAGPFGTAHQHEDKLSMMVYGNGRLLITEGGNYAYDNSEMRKYVLSTRSHNTIRVNNCDQNRMKNYKWDANDITKKSDIKFVTTKEYDFAQGEYNEGYGDDLDIDVLHKRSVYFIKEPVFNNDPFFIVVDRLFSNKNVKNEYEILWHLDEEKAYLNDLNVKTENIEVFVNKIESLQATIKIGEKEPFWQGWKSMGFVQGEYIPSPTICYTLNKNSVRVVTVLCPFSKPCPISNIIASDNVNNTDLTLLLKDGSAKTFDEINFMN